MNITQQLRMIDDVVRKETDLRERSVRQIDTICRESGFGDANDWNDEILPLNAKTGFDDDHLDGGPFTLG